MLGYAAREELHVDIGRPAPEGAHLDIGHPACEELHVHSGWAVCRDMYMQTCSCACAREDCMFAFLCQHHESCLCIFLYVETTRRTRTHLRQSCDELLSWCRIAGKCCKHQHAVLWGYSCGTVGVTFPQLLLPAGAGRGQLHCGDQCLRGGPDAGPYLCLLNASSLVKEAGSVICYGAAISACERCR